MKANIFFQLLILAIITACNSQPNIDEHIEMNKEKAKAKFDSFYACYEIAKNTPPVSTDGIRYEQQDANAEYPNSNCYQISIHNFKDLANPLNIDFDGTRRREHADMARLFNIDLSEHFETHDFGIDDRYSFYENVPDEPEKTALFNAIEHFLNAKYLLINRITEVATPRLLDDETYLEGSAKGDVLVFDLSKIELIGGFKVDVASKDEYHFNENAEPMAELTASLDMSIYEFIKQRFKELTPSIPKQSGIDF
jgi:hypothetical protein